MVGSKTIQKLEHIHCALALSKWRLNPSIALMGSDRISYHFTTRRVSTFSFDILSPLKTSKVQVRVKKDNDTVSYLILLILNANANLKIQAPQLNNNNIKITALFFGHWILYGI